MATDDDDHVWTSTIRPDELTREMPLEAYIDDQLSEVIEGGNDPEDVAEARLRLEAFVQEIRHRALPGDTWWEWVHGTQPLMQMGGLAVVRNGKIVWATMTWIS